MSVARELFTDVCKKTVAAQEARFRACDCQHRHQELQIQLRMASGAGFGALVVDVGGLRRPTSTSGAPNRAPDGFRSWIWSSRCRVWGCKPTHCAHNVHNIPHRPWFLEKTIIGFNFKSITNMDIVNSVSVHARSP